MPETLINANINPAEQLQTPDEVLRGQLTGFAQQSFRYYEGRTPLGGWSDPFNGWQNLGYESDGTPRTGRRQEYRDGAVATETATAEGFSRTLELPSTVTDAQGVHPRLSWGDGNVFEVTSTTPAKGDKPTSWTTYRWSEDQPVSKRDERGEFVALTPEEQDGLGLSLSEWRTSAELRRGNAAKRILKHARAAGAALVGRSRSRRS